eukprot:m.131176 g.131176  ORF g.131176 m.131176 type:complete len:627 (-) comp16453_c1_seq5:246-2126(-)
MVEHRKYKYGVPVTSSEKADTHDRYKDFKIATVPYPGVEWFRHFQKKNYCAQEMDRFDWDSAEVNSTLSIPPDCHAPRDTAWSEYRSWSLIDLTKNYLRLFLRLLRTDASGDSGLLVHCISGWDRTPLFISLLRISLWADGHIHRSLNATQLLYLTVAYDWMLFGHQLKDRRKRGEDIFVFCFDFLQYITGPEFQFRPSDWDVEESLAEAVGEEPITPQASSSAASQSDSSPLTAQNSSSSAAAPLAPVRPAPSVPAPAPGPVPANGSVAAATGAAPSTKPAAASQTPATTTTTMTATTAAAERVSCGKPTQTSPRQTGLLLKGGSNLRMEQPPPQAPHDTRATPSASIAEAAEEEEDEEDVIKSAGTQRDVGADLSSVGQSSLLMSAFTEVSEDLSIASSMEDLAAQLQPHLASRDSISSTSSSNNNNMGSSKSNFSLSTEDLSVSCKIARALNDFDSVTSSRRDDDNDEDDDAHGVHAHSDGSDDQDNSISVDVDDSCDGNETEGSVVAESNVAKAIAEASKPIPMAGRPRSNSHEMGSWQLVHTNLGTRSDRTTAEGSSSTSSVQQSPSQAGEEPAVEAQSPRAIRLKELRDAFWANFMGVLHNPEQRSYFGLATIWPRPSKA